MSHINEEPKINTEEPKGVASPDKKEGVSNWRVRVLGRDRGSSRGSGRIRENQNPEEAHKEMASPEEKEGGSNWRGRGLDRGRGSSRGSGRGIKDHNPEEEHKEMTSPEKKEGGSNWRGRGLDRGRGSSRGSGRGRGDHNPEEHKGMASSEKREGGSNWRGRDLGRGRGSSRGSGRNRGGHSRPEVNCENEASYHFKRDANWSKDSEQGSEVGFEDTGYRNRQFTDRIEEKINYQSGPTYDLPPIDNAEKKFNGRNRLYIANTGPEVTEEELGTLFQPYGETGHIFINKEKNFAFITFDYHANALRAKNDLDGKTFKGRNLKIRFSSANATIKVRNLGSMVSNELLYHAFSHFGEIEEAKVSVDSFGKSLGEGLVHFSRKAAAFTAVKKCAEGCYFLTASLQPVIAEMYDYNEDNEGYPEKIINKNIPEFSKERGYGPRFARPDSFDFEYGQRWKALLELYTQKEKALKNELHLEKEKLVAQMEYAKYEHETEMLRNTLKARELDKERQKREWEFKQKQVEEQQAKTADQMRKYQEQLEARVTTQREDLRRKQQENNLFRQAHTLDSLLDQTERVFDIGFVENSRGNNSNDRESFNFSESVKEERSGIWVNENPDDSYYAAKRRRF